MAKSRLRKDVEDIPEHKRKLYRSLTRISMNVSKAIRESDLSKEDLAEEIDVPVEYINRILGGAVNLKLRTIFKLEEVLDFEFIETKEHESEDSSRKTAT